MINQDNMAPKKGMNRNTHPSEVQEGEYTFAFNANIQDATGDGDYILTNEPSNIKACSLKQGYIVLKHHYDRVRNIVYLWLVNPETNCSEIGKISAIEDFDVNVLEEVICKCDEYAVPEIPLEDIFQEDRCTYETILTDYCNQTGECTGCLNFSIYHPIRGVEIRYSILGDEIHWNDGYNPDRYLKLYDIDNYYKTVDECEGEETPTCLDCDKLRMFKLYEKPCLNVETVSEGGNLRAGMYLITGCYSDMDGTEVSDYFQISNYVSIFDKNNTVLDETQLDYVTSKAIKVSVSNLDDSFNFYKIVIGYSSGQDPVVRWRELDIFPIDQTTFTISQIHHTSASNSTESLSLGYISEEDIVARRPFYLNSKIMTSANGHLMLADLTARREVNLQPIVNLLGAFVKYGTGVAKENLYEFGESTANYRTYSRDEVTPLSIEFTGTGNFTTALFPFIPRPPRADEIAEMPLDLNRESIEANVDTCGDFERSKVWQFINTAEDEGYILCSNSSEGEEVQQEEQVSCDTEPQVLVNYGSVAPVEGSLAIWINENREEIINSTDPSLHDIANALVNYKPFEECKLNIGDNCELVENISDEILVSSVDNERLIDVSVPYNEYDAVGSPISCSIRPEEEERDTFIESILGLGAVVNKKQANSNTSCSSAQAITLNTSQNPASVGSHLVDMGTIGSYTGLVNLSIPVTATNFQYEPYLHNNAIWFRVDFVEGYDSTIFQIGESVCQEADSNTNNSVRISVFKGCPSVVEVPSYGRIVNNTTVVSSSMFVELFATDFPSGTAYIAIDSPMKSFVDFKLSFNGTSGTNNIVIGDTTTTATFNTNLSTTVSDYVSSYGSVLTSKGIVYQVSGQDILCSCEESVYLSISTLTTSPDLEVDIIRIEDKHVLQPPCGCFSVVNRAPITETRIAFDSISFIRRITSKISCTYTKVSPKDCEVAPYREGQLGYWESTFRYPCNDELYNSKTLRINQSRIPEEYRSYFEDLYVDQIVGTEYQLSNEADFKDRPIRHYKLPDNSVAPFMMTDTEAEGVGNYTKSHIYPIGFRIDNEIINSFLDIAVDNNLLSQEERDQITGYRIYRGSRAVEKSIVAKGLLFNMLGYEDYSKEGTNDRYTYYPNYPLNDHSQTDLLNGGYKTFRTRDNFFTFHSPDTHFSKPELSYEMAVEGYQFGVSLNKFTYVKDHVEWVILGKKAQNTSTALATAEIGFEIVTKTADLLTLAGTGGISVIAAGIIAAANIAIFAVTAMQRVGKISYEWRQVFENYGTPYNFGYYGISEGLYQKFMPNTVSNSKLRGLDLSTYIKAGYKRVTTEHNSEGFFINNFKREDSVLLHTAEKFKLNYPTGYLGADTSRYNIPTSKTGTLGSYTRRAASPYVSLKRYLPGQYGSINSVQWVSTGYCGNLLEDNSCDIIYGGDTYISRFSVKRKFPFFTEDAVGAPPNLPFKYSSRFNIATGVDGDYRGYVDYKTSEDNNLGNGVLPKNHSKISLWNGSTFKKEFNKFYVDDANKFLLYYYGFPYFLVESDVNCNYRYSGIQEHEDFYPHFGDVIEHTQEVNVPMSHPNVYKYNKIYSRENRLNAHKGVLSVNFKRDWADKINDLGNAVITSDQDDQSSSRLRSPWLNYKASNFYRFNNANGDLIDLRAIENEMVWARFTDGYEILNAIDPLAERLSPENRVIGTGGMFQQRALTFNVTDLGYNGTQHKTAISTEFGHYSVDSKRGKVFELQPGGKGTVEISMSMDKWMKEQLPFKILKKYPRADVDNPYLGIGIVMGWDDRTKRLFLTKLDYTAVPNTDLEWDEENGFHIKVDRDVVKVRYDDTNYFEPAHFTVAYSPIIKTWISYYSFYPNYYISLNDHFKTGLNSVGNSSHGIWSHYPLLSSFQVFYGEKNPFVIEYVSKTNATKSTIDFVEYVLETRKYTNKYDFSNVFGKGFNKSYIYNNISNSGLLNLKFTDGNNARDLIDYPKYKEDSIDILQSESQDFWTFNYLFDHIKNKRSNIPIWNHDKLDILKTLNPSAIKYTPYNNPKMEGDYFLVRLIQDEDTRNKLIFRFGKTSRNYFK